MPARQHACSEQDRSQPGLPVQKLEDAAAADGPAEVESVDDFVRATALPLRHRRTARPGGGGDGGGGEAAASPRRRSQL